MLSFLRRYTRWLHTRWPAGTVEPLPEIRPDGTTAVPGLRVVGDLTGVPLLKFASDSGARAVRAILDEEEFARGRNADPDVVDLAIVGAGVSGVAAALAAKRAGLRFRIFESAEPFATVANFPKGKPIFTYPAGMRPEGDLQFEAAVHPKEELLAGLERARGEAGIAVEFSRVERVERRGDLLVLHHGPGRHGRALPPTPARRVIVAIGRSGSHRRLDVPGEDDASRVFNRLHDPKDFAGREALVVGGGDSALETAIALVEAGGGVTLVHRGDDLARAKPENAARIERLARDPAADVDVERPSSGMESPATGPSLREGARAAAGSLRVLLRTRVARIEPGRVVLADAAGAETAVSNDVVFTMLGREAPLDFFRRSGVGIRGEWRAGRIAAFAAFLLFCVFLYNWKAGGAVTRGFQERNLFPFQVPSLLARAGGALGAAARNPATLVGTLTVSLGDPGFFYSLAYCLCVLGFGIARIRRRKTPYVARQTWALVAIQWIPLFLLPYVLLPYLGHRGAFDGGFGRVLADNLFPASAAAAHGREYWRAFGFVLAWPLFVWNAFSAKPMAWWLVIAFLQTFVLIPLAIRRWGKGVYCGWICSCGALAETMGDAHREKMPHGPLWNRVNMTGQAVLAAAFLLLAARIVSWLAPASGAGRAAGRFFQGLLSEWSVFGIPLNYSRVVDLFLAGIVGVGFYFWFSGRVWCRFACPLAALMHVYARFSRFRIFPEKAKCISCNVCTAVCHQGIDVMSFANKGVPMEDPQCVRCSACVQACPTGVLAFGRVGAGGLPVYDRVAASPVRMREKETV